MKQTLALAVALPLLGVMLAGCAGLRACSTAAQYPPSVWLDARSWAAAHSGSLRACLNKTCKDLTSAQTGVIQQLVVPSGVASRGGHTVTLRLSSGGGDAVDIARVVMLHRFHEASACGTQTWWQADARLDEEGQMRVSYAGVGPDTLLTPAPAPTPASH